MYSEKIKVLIKEGLHIRPVIKIVKLSRSFKSKISILKKDKIGDAKNLFQIQSLGILYKDVITIEAEGEDEIKAVNDIISLINSI